MGRKRKNKNRNNKSKQQQGGRRKRQKVDHYWVEDCTELLPPEGVTSTMVVTISRSELCDKHTHRPDEVTKNNKKKITSEEEEKACNEDDDDSSIPVGRCEPVVDDEVIDNAFITIQRDSSAKGPPKQFPHQNFKPMPNGDCGDGVTNPYPTSEVPDKYWAQRKRFFSNFDEGIVLDKEGWYSVTPEAIAHHIASRLSAKKKDSVVLDAFCGCGGNSVAFARQPEVSLVVAVDSDKKRLELAAKNASVCNISKEKILFIHGNACEVLQSYKDSKLVEVSSDDSESNNLKKANITTTSDDSKSPSVPDDSKSHSVPDDSKSHSVLDDSKSPSVPDDSKSASDASDSSSSEETNANTATTTDVTPPNFHGYEIGDLTSLPKRIDSIFLSPPWGGMDYETPAHSVPDDSKSHSVPDDSKSPSDDSESSNSKETNANTATTTDVTPPNFHGYEIGDLTSLPKRIDSIFLSPPWGGMDYETTGKRNYLIETCMEVSDNSGSSWNGKRILQASAAATKGPVLFFLPRNINGISLGRNALHSGFNTLEMEQNFLNNKLKTVTAYFGM
eukprot:CAMPEP_0194194590 /NCGR_PEP_ID=MMETSP0154-20130528/75669_1 /TAXON_ID=1049557 /ORGANISM="Thalassiothrix antarctica, Strain L6-D1" /LENGTH=559 /DNA_ID=CAMNT_0038919035 /DNA_START=48 /DNA_END=1728 /DNA_ORIENTATION=+